MRASILLLILLINCRLSFCRNQTSLTDDVNLTPDTGILSSFKAMFKGELIKFVDEVRSNHTGAQNITLSEKCLNALILNSENDDYIQKLITDSTKSKNDVGSYADCKSIIYNDTHNEEDNLRFLDNLNFIIVNIKEPVIDQQSGKEVDSFDTRKEMGSYVLGFCVAKGCTDDEYKHIITLHLLVNRFNFTNGTTVEVNNLSEAYQDYGFGFAVAMFFGFIIALFILFTCFTQIPVFLFKSCFSCFKNKKGDISYDSINEEISLHGKEEEEIKKTHILDVKEFVDSVDVKKKNGKYNTIVLNKFADCFDIHQNFDKYDTRNVSGVAFMSGLSALCMIVFCISLINYSLYTSPFKVFCKNTYKHLLLSPQYGLIVFGQRHAYVILFAISGFLLTYKLICFLDKELESIPISERNSLRASNIPSSKANPENSQLPNNDLETEKEKQTETVKFSRLTSEIEEEEKKRSATQVNGEINQRSNSIILSYIENSPSLITGDSYIKFFNTQIHKYILLLLFMSFFKFAMYRFNIFFSSAVPSWVNLRLYVYDRFIMKDYIKSIFLIDTFVPKDFSTCSTFWMTLNEMVFFLFTSLTIFVCYKYSFRLDIVFLVSIISLISIKVIAYAIILADGVEFYPSMAFSGTQLNFYILHPLWSYSSYLIGSFFGIVNYCIQRGEYNNDKEIKPYMKIPLKVVNLLKSMKACTTYVLLVLAMLFIVGSCLALKLAYTFYGYDYDYSNEDDGKGDQYMSKTIKSLSLNFFCLIDVDIVVAVIFVVFISFFLKGDNLFITFFSNKNWHLITHSYFFYTLTAYPVVSVILYQSDSRIVYDFVNIMFISIYAIIFLFVLNYFLTLLFEIPLKRLSVFISEEKRKRKRQSKVAI